MARSASAAGDASEFYTPRPVVRFIIEKKEARIQELLTEIKAALVSSMQGASEI